MTPEVKGENEAFTASDMTFGSNLIVAYTMGALTKVSRELFEDSPSLFAEQVENWLTAKMAQQIDEWGLNGDGGTEPLGILNRSGINSTTSIGAIDWTDASAAVQAVRGRNHEPGGMVVNTTIYGDLLELETGDGSNSARGWLGAPPTMDGVTVYNTTHCPLESAITGDFSKFAMGVRGDMRIEASTVAGEAFERHQIWLKVVARIGFAPLDESAFHILSGITS